MSEESLRAARLLSALPDAVVEVDARGLVRRWLGAAEAVFGWTAADAEGRPLGELFAPRASSDVEAVLSLGRARAIDLLTTCRRSDGSAFAAAVGARSLGGGRAVLQVRPAGREFEEAAEGQRSSPQWDRTLGRLVGSVARVAAAEPAAVERSEALAGALVEEARRMIPGTEVLFSLVPHDRPDSFRIIAAAGGWAETLVGREWPRAGTVAGRSMQLRRSIETVSIADSSVLRATIQRGAIHAARLVPLWTREPLPDGRDAVGVLGWYRREARYFSPHQRRLMREFSRLASLMLQRAELSAAATRSVARLESVVDAARALTRWLDPALILDVLVDRGRELVGADRAVVFRSDAGRITVLAGYDGEVEAPAAGVVLPADAVRGDDGTPLVERVLESGAAIFATGYQVTGLRTGLESRPVRHVAAVPVGIPGQPGLLLFFSRRRDLPFASADLSMLEMVAGIAALALRNAALFGEVEEADRVKSEFLNLAAHELRTPLTVVRGYLSMMGDATFGELPGGWRQPVELLRLKCDELGRLVEDLLLAARLESGAVTAERRPVDLNQLAAQAVEAVRGGGARAARIRCEPAQRPLVVAGDPEHLLRVLQALLANALAYSEGEPWVRVRVAAATAGEAEIEVEDRGRGIEPGLHEKVFERFVRGSPGEPVAGTGLGLFIARRLMERQGGRLELAWSAPGEGSRFVLRLPELEPRHDD